MMMAFYDGDVGDDNCDGDATYYDIMILGQNLRCFCDHLWKRMFDQISTTALDQLPEDGDVLSMEGVDVGGELVEVHLYLGRRLGARVLQFQSKVQTVLVRTHTLGHLLVDEEQWWEARIVFEAEISVPGVKYM